MKVVYLEGDMLCVVHPTPEALEEFGIDAIAQKDVPAGKPYKIVATEDLPQDRSKRADWTIDVRALTDGVGSVSTVIDKTIPKREAIETAPGLIKIRQR